MDIDNLIAGLKQFIDAIALERYIHDDSPKWLELEVKQEKSKEYNILVERKVLQ
jgi:Holliday junction resolvase RusA-like endonuclease